MSTEKMDVFVGYEDGVLIKMKNGENHYGIVEKNADMTYTIKDKDGVKADVVITAEDVDSCVANIARAMGYTSQEQGMLTIMGEDVRRQMNETLKPFKGADR